MKHNNHRKLRAKDYNYLDSLGHYTHMGRIMFWTDPVMAYSDTMDEVLRQELLMVGEFCGCGNTSCSGCRELEIHNQESLKI